MESIFFIATNKKLPLPVICFLIILLSIMLYLFGIAGIEEIQEVGFLFFGIPIIYTSLVFGSNKGNMVIILSLLGWLIGVSSQLIKEFENGAWESIFIEGLLLPISFFIGCILICRAISKEKNLLIKYRQLATEMDYQNKSLRKHHIGIVKTLTKTIDAKDSYTYGHSERVACYALAVAKEAGLSPIEQRDIFYASALHDIGKIGVSDDVLFKDCSLTSDEMNEMRNHPAIGAEIIKELEISENVKSYIYSHHERYGGFGYPLGLKGDEIPLGARIISVVDAYDAIISQRNYNRDRNLTSEEAIEEIKANIPNQFDPEIVNIFINLIHSENINLNFKDCLNNLIF